MATAAVATSPIRGSGGDRLDVDAPRPGALWWWCSAAAAAAWCSARMSIFLRRGVVTDSASERADVGGVARALEAGIVVVVARWREREPPSRALSTQPRSASCNNSRATLSNPVVRKIEVDMARCACMRSSRRALARSHAYKCSRV